MSSGFYMQHLWALSNVIIYIYVYEFVILLLFFIYICLCYLAVHILLATFIFWSCICPFLLLWGKNQDFFFPCLLIIGFKAFSSLAVTLEITFILGILRFATFITARTSYSLTILPPLLSFVMLHFYFYIYL